MEKYIDAMMQKIENGDFVPNVELKELLQNHIQNIQSHSSIWSKRRKSSGIELAKKLLEILNQADSITSVVNYLNVNHEKVEEDSELSQILSAIFSVCINQLPHIHEGLLSKFKLQDVWEKRCTTTIEFFINQIKHETDMQSISRAFHCLSQIKNQIPINNRSEIIERLMQLISSNVKEEYMLISLEWGYFTDWLPENYASTVITGLTKTRNELYETCYDDNDVIPINKLYSEQFRLEKVSMTAEMTSTILRLVQLERLNNSEFRELLNSSILSSGMISNINSEDKLIFTENLIRFLKNNNDDLIDLAVVLIYNLPHWIQDDQKENVANLLISHLSHNQVNVRTSIYNVLPTIKEWMPVAQREEIVKSLPLSYDDEPEYYAALNAFISYVDYLNPSLKFLLLGQMSDHFWQGKIAFIHLYNSYKKDFTTDILQNIKSETNKTLPLEMAREIVNRI